MTKKHHYYIECTFDENGANWQRWSEENYLSFAKIKADVWKLSQQETEFNQQGSSEIPLESKIKGFRVAHETVEIKKETIFECLF